MSKFTQLRRIYRLILIPRFGRGDLKHTPHKFGKISLDVIRKAEKSTNSGSKGGKEVDDQCEKCKKIIDYVFGPTKTADLQTTNKEEASKVIENPEFQMHMHGVAKEKFEDIVRSKLHVKHENQSEKCQRIIKEVFGTDTPPKTGIIDQSNNLPSNDCVLEATTAKKEEEKLMQKIETLEEIPIVETEKSKNEGFNSTPNILGHTTDANCLQNTQSNNLVCSKDCQENMLFDEKLKSSNHKHYENAAELPLKNIEKENSIEYQEGYKNKEFVDEKKLKRDTSVEPECTVPSSYGQHSYYGQNCYYCNSEQNFIDFQKQYNKRLVSENEKSENSLQGHLHNFADDSANNCKRGSSETEIQLSIDELAKKCLDSPKNQIDERLLKEMEKLSVPPTKSSTGTSIIDKDVVQIEVFNKLRKPEKNTDMEFEAREVERDNQNNNIEKLYPSYVAAHFDKDIINKDLNVTELQHDKTLHSTSNFTTEEISNENNKESSFMDMSGNTNDEILKTFERPQKLEPNRILTDPYDKKTSSYDDNENDYDRNKIVKPHSETNELEDKSRFPNIETDKKKAANFVDTNENYTGSSYEYSPPITSIETSRFVPCDFTGKNTKAENELKTDKNQTAFASKWNSENDKLYNLSKASDIQVTNNFKSDEIEPKFDTKSNDTREAKDKSHEPEIDDVDPERNESLNSKEQILQGLVQSKAMMDELSEKNDLKRPIKGNLSSLGPLPKLAREQVSLAELLRIVRERNKMQYCKEFETQALKSSVTEVDTVEGSCGNKPPSCPPSPPKCPPSPPKCPPPPPKCPPPSKCPPPPCPPPPPPCPKPCKPVCPEPCPPPKKSPCDKYTKKCFATMSDAIRTLLFGQQLSIVRSKVTEALAQKADISKEVMAKLRTLGILLKGIREDSTLSVDMSYTSPPSKLTFARDFQPWTPIPSWPIPRQEKKKPLVSPKEGCKVFPPVNPYLPWKPEHCPGFPRRKFSLPNLSSSRFDERKIFHKEYF